VPGGAGRAVEIPAVKVLLEEYSYYKRLIRKHFRFFSQYPHPFISKDKVVHQGDYETIVVSWVEWKSNDHRIDFFKRVAEL